VKQVWFQESIKAAEVQKPEGLDPVIGELIAKMKGMSLHWG